MINQLVINALIASGIYTLIAISFSLIYQTTRFFHFAHAVVFTSGSYFIKNEKGTPEKFQN